MALGEHRGEWARVAAVRPCDCPQAAGPESDRGAVEQMEVTYSAVRRRRGGGRVTGACDWGHGRCESESESACRDRRDDAHPYLLRCTTGSGYIDASERGARRQG